MCYTEQALQLSIFRVKTLQQVLSQDSSVTLARYLCTLEICTLNGLLLDPVQQMSPLQNKTSGNAENRVWRCWKLPLLKPHQVLQSFCSLCIWLWHEHRTQPTITILLHLKNSARNSLLLWWEEPLCSQAYCATVIKFLLKFCLQYLTSSHSKL